jgi:predicted nucleotidyltransferase
MKNERHGQKIGKINNLPRFLKKGKVEEKLFRICEEHDVVLMAILGSLIRREQKRGSDIDVAIEFDKNSKTNLLDLVHLERDLRRIFKRKVDLGVFSSISPYIIDDVKKEMKVICEKR